MNREELLAKAKYVQFPATYGHYNNYGIQYQVCRLPLPEQGMMYDGYSLNENHFTPTYHQKFVVPALAKLLDIPFSKPDFEIVPRLDSSSRFDLSYLRPRHLEKYRYEVFGFNQNEHLDNLSYEDLLEGRAKIEDARTEYHQKYYMYAHENSRLINKTCTSSRKLFISGDSQMIPDIAPLSIYFQEIWYMDNRANLQLASHWANVDFTDVLIELNCAPLGSYTSRNFQ